jgi:glucose-1-phosphate adenylyltransferase
VAAGATVDRAILDANVRIGANAVVGAADGDLALVGRRVEVPDGERIPPGARLEPW